MFGNTIINMGLISLHVMILYLVSSNDNSFLIAIMLSFGVSMALKDALFERTIGWLNFMKKKKLKKIVRSRLFLYGIAIGVGLSYWFLCALQHIVNQTQTLPLVLEMFAALYFSYIFMPAGIILTHTCYFCYYKIMKKT